MYRMLPDYCDYLIIFIDIKSISFGNYNDFSGKVCESLTPTFKTNYMKPSDISPFQRQRALRHDDLRYCPAQC
jgi:hypothetical protein